MRSVGRYAPALALMGVIFLLSSQSSLPRVDNDLGLLLSKGAHMVEFGLLWALWLWALPGPRSRAALGALTITMAYAVSDEFHQSFVVARQASPLDVAIDAAGVGVAVAVWATRARHARGPAG